MSKLFWSLTSLCLIACVAAVAGGNGKCPSLATAKSKSECGAAKIIAKVQTAKAQQVAGTSASCRAAKAQNASYAKSASACAAAKTVAANGAECHGKAARTATKLAETQKEKTTAATKSESSEDS